MSDYDSTERPDEGMGLSSERTGHVGPDQPAGTSGERPTHPTDPEGDTPPEQAPGNDEENPVGIPPKAPLPREDPDS